MRAAVAEGPCFCGGCRRCLHDQGQDCGVKGCKSCEQVAMDQIETDEIMAEAREEADRG